MTEQELQQYLLSEYPCENASCEWKEIGKLPESLSSEQKITKIGNLLTFLRKKGCITVDKNKVWNYIQPLPKAITFTQSN